ncbi:MAG: ribonuclease J, partial [Acidimicrobiia bacterium]|nr:ribonuclease J [Acidimicrobiia bacterium]
PKEIHDALRETVEASIERITERPIDHDTLRRRVRNSAGKAVRKRTNRRPVVFPVIIEV